ncbi:MAG: hypothetical protein AAGI01_10285, partial [Myxococcota bacterium]
IAAVGLGTDRASGPKEDPEENQRAENVRSLGEERLLVANQAPIAAALKELDAGHAGQAAATFAMILKRDATNPHVHYFAGRAHHERGAHQEAFASHLETLRLDPRYGDDPLILEVLASCMAAKAAQCSTAELDALLPHPKQARLRESLSRIATGELEPQRIGRLAYDKLKGADALPDLAEWRQRTLTMLYANECAKKRDALDRLVADRITRALPMIRRLQKRPKSGCGVLRLKDCLGCIRDDLAKAERTLSRKES